MTYGITLEDLERNYPEMEPLYRAHFREMRDRLEADGLEIADYNPRLQQYFAACRSGHLLHYVARKDGRAVGYANVYLTNDMHNGEFIAKEDTIFVTPEHRNGLGRKIVRFVLADLAARGVKRVWITPVTDLRVAKIWKRMGFREMASLMVYNF